MSTRYFTDGDRSQEARDWYLRYQRARNKYKRALRAERGTECWMCGAPCKNLAGVLIHQGRKRCLEMERV